MQILKTIRHCDLFPNDVPKDNENFVVRKAARAVVFDAEDRVAILKVGKHGFHKLQGVGWKKEKLHWKPWREK